MSRMLRHDPVIVISCTRHLMGLLPWCISIESIYLALIVAYAGNPRFPGGFLP